MRTLIGSFIVVFGLFAAGCAAESTSTDDANDEPQTTGSLFSADDVGSKLSDDQPLSNELPARNPAFAAQRSALSAAHEDRGIDALPSKLSAANERRSMDDTTTSVGKLGH